MVRPLNGWVWCRRHGNDELAGCLRRSFSG
ncbi:hypothetical protein X970_15825 [Pseudomonas monteilii SB3101]|uniref:Uncharacterized protein n=1 Tax=Pseudomonas monteilii SB3101 TaxID=1435058 RepID=V9VB52_9PSED|nr:hypothetical protein X969_16180 [Pseudomonas monteilii SB3078]AHC91135.1 hypothetical protein X970_15825 [Pseudomonas monteilii SB3101]